MLFIYKDKVSFESVPPTFYMECKLFKTEGYRGRRDLLVGYLYMYLSSMLTNRLEGLKQPPTRTSLIMSNSCLYNTEPLYFTLCIEEMN